MQTHSQEWILDSITEYLKSPVWKNPILEFIDEYCIVFDDDEENKLEYTDIHNKFKKIVDQKLEAFVTDLGIPADVFVNSCEVSSNKIHKSIINQLLAVENFLLFKKMMIARNKQLNEEAIKNLRQEDEDDGDDDLEEQAEREREEAELAQAIAMSQALEDARLQKLHETQNPQVMEPQIQNQQPEEEKKQSTLASEGLPSIGVSKKQAVSVFDDINIEEDQEDKEKREKDSKERQERLKIQRDKLLQKKQQERQSEIQDYHKGQEDKAKGVNQEEEEKNQRIKKGLAALSLDKKVSEQEIQQKRKNFMSEIRDALITGDQESSEATIKKVKKGKKTRKGDEDDFL
ncbi:coiled-coil domain-containing protein 104 [Stylonychia lemnae]|uniref:Cilia- and flagella-associated protein 36 n=1 Tax=Stylonychia lemnae TaxID=5949 RepID=A0A078ANE5_STYLE|nr:coiled-coil domain-containing protein 104 [Stylonychia lemnae]|eukprot:CDW82473.1 coiled-coil domain-containing protein 104 [Stylonychia lemnae]